MENNSQRTIHRLLPDRLFEQKMYESVWKYGPLHILAKRRNDSAISKDQSTGAKSWRKLQENADTMTVVQG